MTTKTKTTKNILYRSLKPPVNAPEYQLINLIPIQTELQKIADVAVNHVRESTGGVVYGNLLISLDYVHSRRSVVHGHYSKKSWVDGKGREIACIAINPYDIGNRTGAEVFGTIVHEAVHHGNSFTENKILFGFPKSPKTADGYTSDTSNQGRYHGPNFKKVVDVVPWLDCVKDTEVGHVTELSAAGIKAAEKLLIPGIFDGLHKVLEPKSAKRGSQYVSYRCADEACKFSSQVSGGLAKAIDNGEEDISQHHGSDMVKK